MANYKKKEVEDPKHIHIWMVTTDLAAMTCECGKWLISAQERDRRKAEWDNYFQLITTTPSYLDWVEIYKAYREKNGPKIKELSDRAEERLARNEYFLGPSFPDPDSYPYIVSQEGF